FSATVMAPPPLFIDNIQSNPPTSVGGNDGTFSFDVNGGTAPYAYSWTGPVTGNANAPTPGSVTINNLPAGDYSLTILDDNNCELIRPFTITDFACSFSITNSEVIDVSCAEA
ncbi:MAG: SprB repeat-containing protein, partial [Bacteroidota bacterium]